MMTSDQLNIAEIFYESGEIHYRYSRYLSGDQSSWIRNGLFRSYYRNGKLSSEGFYEDGREQGVWKDFHENGRLAAEGQFESGKEVGIWRYWNADGTSNNE
jgi:antitoxin component YwqK of YwqJK toxin-antitoxin module